MSTILIIDDDSVEATALREALGDGFTYECAASGRDARAIMEAKPEDIDAILLDWELPDGDGIELLDWVRGQPALNDVVVESAVIVPDKIRAGIDRGAYYYLTKPYDEAQLQAIVAAAVECCEIKRSMHNKVTEANDVLRLLQDGTFRLQTFAEAEALAVRPAASCNDPHKGLGLLELLLNAIEHGNLGISYEDKSRLLEAGTLREEIRRQLHLAENRDKRVIIESTRDTDRLRLCIKDYGPGFDDKKYLKVDPQRLFDAHGRGIMLADSLLDLEYVEPGNQVRVSVAYSHRT